MKSYKQFVSETYTAQERLDEFVVPILKGVGRLVEVYAIKRREKAYQA